MWELLTVAESLKACVIWAMHGLVWTAGKVAIFFQAKVLLDDSLAPQYSPYADFGLRFLVGF